MLCAVKRRGVGAVNKGVTATETWRGAFNLLMMKWLERRNNDETPPRHQSVARRRVSACQGLQSNWFSFVKAALWNVSKSARDSRFSHLCRLAFISEMLPIKSFTHIYSASSIKNTVRFLRRFDSQRYHPYKLKFSASVFWHPPANYFMFFLLYGAQSNSSLTRLDERR